MQSSTARTNESVLTAADWLQKINDIREKQKQILGSKRFGDVSFELQSQWCILQRRLGTAAYDAYHALIHCDDLVAAQCFDIAYLANHDRIGKEVTAIHLAFANHQLHAMTPDAQDEMLPFLSCRPDEIYWHGLALVLYLDQPRLGVSLLYHAAHIRNHISAQLILADIYRILGQTSLEYKLRESAQKNGSSLAKTRFALRFMTKSKTATNSLIYDAAYDGEMNALSSLGASHTEQYMMDRLASIPSKEQAINFNRLAALQGSFQALINAHHLVSKCLLNDSQAARWIRDRINDGYHLARERLKTEADIPAKIYHQYHHSVIARNTNNTAALLDKHPELEVEYVQDFLCYRKKEDDLLVFLYNVLDELNLSEFSALKAKKLIIQFLENNLSSPPDDIKENHAIRLQLLRRIDMADLKEVESISVVLACITDDWFYLASQPADADHLKLREELIAWINKIIFNIAARGLNNAVTDSCRHTLRLCSVAIIKFKFGEECDLLMSEISFNQLLSLVSLVKTTPSISVSEVHTALRCDFISIVPYAEILDNLVSSNLLPQFSQYLKQNWVTAGNRDLPTQRVVMSYLVNSANEFINASEREHSNLFRQTVGEALTMLAKRNFTGLQYLLREKIKQRVRL